MKARTLLCGLALCTLGAVAQTEVSPYVPGATVEGVTYYLPSSGRRGRKASLYPRRIQQICRPLSPFVPNKPGTLHEVEYKKYRYGTLRSTRSSKSLQHTA